VNAPIVRPRVLSEIKKYGAADISACFNCGNCSAVCPLSEGTESFPRRVIRLGQLGQEQALLASNEPWLCHYCGECTRTCPRQADPGEYMAALRRWTIARLEPTGIGGLLLRNTWGMLLVSAALAAILGVFLLRIKVSAGEAFDGWPFRALVAYGTIHSLGIAVGALLTASLVVSVARFVWARRSRPRTDEAPKLTPWSRAARETLGDLITLRRHRSETRPRGSGWLRDPWFIHILIFGGFMGLLAATLLDFVVLYLMQSVFHLSMFLPARVLGTAAGLAMLAGVILAILRRVRRDGPSATTTRAADAWLLGLLLLLAITGFWLEVAVTFDLAGKLSDWVLLIHSALAMELVLLLGATKLAHAVYRPLALLFMHRRRDPSVELSVRPRCSH